MESDVPVDASVTAAVPHTNRERLRQRIIEAATTLVVEHGRDALTTRAVASAIGLPAPTIYRLFADKAALVDAVAEHGFASYVADKPAVGSADPLVDFRRGWEVHVGFGLAHPGLFGLMFGDPAPGRTSTAALAGEHVLRLRIRRLAAAGLLRVGVEQAVELVQAAGQGIVLRLLSHDERDRDVSLVDIACDMVIAAITTVRPTTDAPGPASAAITLRAYLPEIDSLSDNERDLLGEWLDRIVDSTSTNTPSENS